MKRTLSILAAATACLALICASAIPALAATPRGTLSSREYTLLSSSQKKLLASLKRKPINWSVVRGGCRAVGGSTALLQSERASCLAQTELLQGLVLVPSRLSSCGTDQPHREICMLPLYRGIAKTAGAVYRTDTDEYQRAMQRGFSGRCLAALSNTSKQLGQQQDLANASETLYKDVQVETEISEGKLPSGDITVAKADADAKAFEHDTNLVLAENTPKLTVCPHQ